MSGRLEGKSAIVFGAGSSGPGWGNGKAAAVAYAREGACVACVDLAPEAVLPALAPTLVAAGRLRGVLDHERNDPPVPRTVGTAPRRLPGG